MKITKRQLLRIIREEKARIAEQTVGVEDVSQSEDAFGGGDVEEEIFVDADADSLLNQNDDPGEVTDIEVIPERVRLKRHLRKIVSEVAGGGGALPPVDDLATKLASVGSEEALDFIQRVLAAMSRKAGASAAPAEDAVVEPPAPMPPVPDEEV
jgi:hypothetical protein